MNHESPLIFLADATKYGNGTRSRGVDGRSLPRAVPSGVGDPNPDSPFRKSRLAVGSPTRSAAEAAGPVAPERAWRRRLALSGAAGTSCGDRPHNTRPRRPSIRSADAHRTTATGTHRGELMGIKPTNRRTVTHGCSVKQLKNDKAVHDCIYWDTGHLLRQLGVLPAA